MPGQSAMPAADASSAAVHVLSARPGDVLPGGKAGGPLPGLAGFLAAVPDHRRAQGRRHSLACVPGLACAATAAGAKSLVAIAERAADAPAAVPAVRCRTGAGATFPTSTGAAGTTTASHLRSETRGSLIFHRSGLTGGPAAAGRGEGSRRCSQDPCRPGNHPPGLPRARPMLPRASAQNTQIRTIWRRFRQVQTDVP